MSIGCNSGASWCGCGAGPTRPNKPGPLAPCVGGVLVITVGSLMGFIRLFTWIVRTVFT